MKKCIEDYRDAGIKVWMLTGDKGATAEEIGYSCGLLQKTKVVAEAIDESRITEFDGWLSRVDKLCQSYHMNRDYPPVSVQQKAIVYKVAETEGWDSLQKYFEGLDLT